ncbi:MAG: hypothetical protein EOM22_16510 [Gammaproteobacteria bacterium]|nr:hypothetical protein [Gammaproteobacteria bacterium]
MARQNIKVRSGNRIRVVMDGKQVGLIQDVRGSDDYGPEPASGCGDIHVQEYVPTMARHSVQVSQMVLITDSLRSLGISLENGDDALKGMVFDIEVVDKESGAVLRKYVDCSYAQGDIDVRKHAIVMGSGTFNALDVTGKVM